MATIQKRKITLSIEWSKENPGNLSYVVTALCSMPDDHKDTGEETFTVRTLVKTITRAQFRNLTGQQIESQSLSQINAVLQDLGTGAGTHTLEDDFGS